MKMTWAETGFVKTLVRLVKQYPAYFFSMIVLPLPFSVLILLVRHRFVYLYTPPISNLNGGFLDAYQYIWNHPKAYTQLFPPSLMVVALLFGCLLLSLLYRKSEYRKAMLQTVFWCHVGMILGCTLVFGVGWILYWLFGLMAVADFYSSFNGFSMTTLANLIGLLAYYLLFYYRSKTMLYGKKKSRQKN